MSKLDFLGIIAAAPCERLQLAQHTRVDLPLDLVADAHRLRAERGRKQKLTLLEEWQRFQDPLYFRRQRDKVRPRLTVFTFHPFGRDNPLKLFGREFRPVDPLILLSLTQCSHHGGIEFRP
jgi:hypothetical protein